MNRLVRRSSSEQLVESLHRDAHDRGIRQQSQSQIWYEEGRSNVFQSGVYEGPMGAPARRGDDFLVGYRDRGAPAFGVDA